MNKLNTAFFIFSITLIIASCKTPKTHLTTEKKLLNTIDFTKNYAIDDEEFGTKTSFTIKGDKRIIKTNSLPNHKTGRFPNAGNPNNISAQRKEYVLPIKPINTGKPKWAREFGVALNGVKFEPETAERFVCETGEVYRIEAKQDVINLGLDENNAHVQPTGAYHYHGIPLELIMKLDKGEDLILIGYAKDGFPIYYSQSNAYKPSFKLSEKSRSGDVCEYKNPHQSSNKELNNTKPDGIFVSDWEYVKGVGDLDECNGIMLSGQYVYFATFSYPYIGRCLKGEFQESRPQGPPPRGHIHKN